METNLIKSCVLEHGIFTDKEFADFEFPDGFFSCGVVKVEYEKESE